jgi:hypothetical protein
VEPVAGLKDIVVMTYDVEVEVSQVAGCMWCLLVVADFEVARNLVAVERNLANMDLVGSANSRAEVTIPVARIVVHNLRIGLDMLELDRCRNSLHLTHLKVQLPDLDMDSK